MARAFGFAGRSAEFQKMRRSRAFEARGRVWKMSGLWGNAKKLKKVLALGWGIVP